MAGINCMTITLFRFISLCPDKVVTSYQGSRIECTKRKSRFVFCMIGRRKKQFSKAITL